MQHDRLLLDTVYIQAFLNKHDQHHEKAMTVFSSVRHAGAVWVTEPVLMEVAAALSSLNRAGVAAFIRQCYATANIHVVTVDAALFQRGLALYEKRLDKTWSLVDCISFVTMRENGIYDAVTSDHHFAQAGFRILM